MGNNCCFKLCGGLFKEQNQDYEPILSVDNIIARDTNLTKKPYDHYSSVNNASYQQSITQIKPNVAVATINQIPHSSEKIEINPGKDTINKQTQYTNSNSFYLNYELKEEIGVGSTSKCYNCMKKSNGKIFACKVIDKRQVEMKFSGLLEQFFTEIKVLKTLNHPNIIRFEETYETQERIYIIMENMKGGELFDYVVEKGTLSEEEASILVRKITSAVAHMHGMNIIHRDLKPENLLLNSKGSDAEVKLIDFGLAKVMREPVASSFLGTKGYLAPEMLQRHSYDKAIDIWSLGVIVFVLLCGCLPFDDDSSRIPDESAARKKFTLRFPKWANNLSPSAKDLLNNLLEIDPKKRFTADQALNHPWVSGKTVQPNSYLQSPCVISERRNELRSPAMNNAYKYDSHVKHNGNNNNSKIPMKTNVRPSYNANTATVNSRIRKNSF